MYNNTQRNRAGALEELNKFFLGKDEQIALSDLPPLRSPQAMPRGYKDGENVTQDTGAGSLLGPSSTPGMVIDPDFKGISGLDVEFDPTTGEVTDLG